MEASGRLRVSLTPREARELQERLRDRVVKKGVVRARTVAGVDVSEREGTARAAIVVMREGETVEEATHEEPVAFPYVPGLLSFRELPPLLAAWRRLKSRPDVVLVDGQGYAHPRRFGLACHLGVLLRIPTIGCAKSVLLGTFDPPARPRGSWSAIKDGGETIGAALRTQTGVQPLYISIGHRISLRGALRIVLDHAPRYRLPEPQRRADRLSKAPFERISS
jgi:deoxyribonuclease V